MTAIKRFRNWSFETGDWNSADPVLLRGEIGVEEILDDNGDVVARKFKLGDESTPWSQLPYLEPYYEDGEVPLSPIGDTNQVLKYKSVSEVLKLMLNPYQTPSITSVTNNASGSHANSHSFEVGSTVTGPIDVNWSVNNASNLEGATPISIDGGGLFSNEGLVANSGSFSLSFINTYAPTVLKTLTISLTATHKRGTTGTSKTYIKHFPRVYWTYSQSEDITLLTSGMSYALKSSVADVYSFAGAGYFHFFLPVSLSQSDIEFWDESTGLQFAVTDMGKTVTRTNGSHTYELNHYRSTYYQASAKSVRIKL